MSARPPGRADPCTAPQGQRAGPEGCGLGAQGLSSFWGASRQTLLPLTFSSTQLTMMDGYLRLSHRKNAGTPIAEVQLEGAARPAKERNLRNRQSGGRGHRHFLPRARQRQEVMSRQRRQGRREGGSNGRGTSLRDRLSEVGLGCVACGDGSS